MDPSEAKRKELKAILLYTIVAWNVAGFGIYMITKDRDENERLKQIDLTPGTKRTSDSFAINVNSCFSF